jgi:hypothetical protein
LPKAITIEVEKVQGGYLATLTRGGKLNPIPIHKKKFANTDLLKLLSEVAATALESLKD